MFNKLTEDLQNIFSHFQGKSHITEDNIDVAVQEVRRALIQADVSIKAIKTFTSRIHEKAIGELVLKGISPKEQFIKIVSDELTFLLGNKHSELNLPISAEKPNVILILGLQGSGKTTTCAKLAKLLKKKNKSPLLVGLDLKRPAAVHQLKMLGDQAGVDAFAPTETPHEAFLLAQNAIDFAKKNKYDVVIIDSAGRLQIDNVLMAELLLVDRQTQPTEKLLVVDSMTGQEAANVAAAFDTQIGITGIILTKLDGDARGGAALSVVEETKRPIKFIGVGEKLDDLQEFHPERISSRILGMGDVLTLVEQAQEKIKEEEAKEIEKKLLGDFNFESFLQAQEMISKLGSFSSIFNMLGIGGMLNKLGASVDKESQDKLLLVGEARMKKFKAAICSMTKEERKKPELLNPSRKRRIASGSAQKEKDIDELVSEFKQMKKLMENLKPFMGLAQGLDSNILKQGGFDILKSPVDRGSSLSLKPNLLKGFKPKKNK